jgi:DNA primase
MIAELEDVEFTNPLYKSIYEAFVAGAARGEAIGTLYFMEHGTSEIRAVVAELTTPRYEVSKNWGGEWQIFFPHEKEILHDMAYSNVLRLKFRMIQKLMEDNLDQMKSAGDNTAEFEKYFTIHEQLVAAQKELAVALGIVIPGGGRPAFGASK